MCLPALPLIALAASGVSAGMGAYSSIQQGNYQAAVAKNNAKIADQNAIYTKQAGQAAETAQRLKTAQTVGAARAAAGAAGLDPNSGSPLNVQSDTAKLGELDALTIRSNYNKDALGFKNQSAVYGADAKMAKTAGKMGAVSSILSGASSVGDKYASFSQSGLLK